MKSCYQFFNPNQVKILQGMSGVLKGEIIVRLKLGLLSYLVFSTTNDVLEAGVVIEVLISW